MAFIWDETKNVLNIRNHGLDFASGEELFRAPIFTTLDTRFDYGESRYVGIGMLRATVVVVIFTEPA